MNTRRRPGAPTQNPEINTMTRTFTTGAVFTSLLLGACATAPSPPPALVEARMTVRSAELDPAVLANAPLELQRASATLDRANRLLAKGEPLAEVSSAAYVAHQQARTAMAISQAKRSDAAIAGAQVDRERTRADIRTVEAERAQAQASSAQAQARSAQAQAGIARQQTAAAEQRASGAELQAAIAQSSASEAQLQAAELQQRLADLQGRQTERGMLVTLGDVLFEFNRAEVKPGAQSSLRKLADFLQQYPTRRVLIEGYTDNIGSTASNDILSLRRADAVDSALMGMGVAGQRIDTVGYGEQFPIADNSTDTNRALNRRVEVYIAENDQPVRARR